MHLRRECDDAHGDEHRERRHARKEGPLRPSALLRQNDTQAQLRQLRSPSPSLLVVAQRGRPRGLPQCGHCNYRTVRIAMAISVADRRLRTWAGAPEGIAPYVTFTMAHSPK